MLDCTPGMTGGPTSKTRSRASSHRWSSPELCGPASGSQHHFPQIPRRTLSGLPHRSPAPVHDNPLGGDGDRHRGRDVTALRARRCTAGGGPDRRGPHHQGGELRAPVLRHRAPAELRGRRRGPSFKGLALAAGIRLSPNGARQFALTVPARADYNICPASLERQDEGHAPGSHGRDSQGV